MEQKYTDINAQRVRETVRACLSTAERKDDMYVSVHRDADGECAVLVSMLRCCPVFSVIVADRALFSEQHAAQMYAAAAALHAGTHIGLVCVSAAGDTPLYMYRRCFPVGPDTGIDRILDILHACIAAYRISRAGISGTGESGQYQERNLE